MRIGVICGDIYHPADTIIKGLTALDLPDATFEFMLTTADWSNERLADCPLWVIAKGNSRTEKDFAPWLTDDVQLAFEGHVDNGGSLFVIHSGTVGYRNDERFRTLVGGVFDHHPEQCDVTVEYLDGAPLSKDGVDPFAVRDEHYFVELFRDDLDVFLTSTSTNGVQPAGWTRRQGSGRVCVVTPGHNAEVWAHPTYQSILRDCFAWCMA